MRSTRWLAPALVVLMAVLAYSNTLGFGFTWDDEGLIRDNASLEAPGQARHLLLEGRLWRPVKRLSLLVDERLWGVDHPEGFHATNILLHAFACFLLYALARRLGLGQGAAAVAGLLFALHPVHVEAVANISHRKESLALLFGLLAFLAYLRARSDKPPRGLLALLGLKEGRAAGIAGRAEHVLYAGFCYLLAMLSKEVAAVMLPAVILVHDMALTPEPLLSSRRARWLAAAAAPFLLVLVLFTVRGHLATLPDRFTAENVEWVTQGKTSSYGLLLLTDVKAFGAYAGLLAWPWPLYLDRLFPLATGLADPGLLAGIVLLAAYAAALVVTWRISRIAFFALAWYGLNLLPVINVVPLTYWLIAERFLYVPSVGFALLVAIGVDAAWIRLPPAPSRWRPLAAALVGLFLLGLGGLTFIQNRVWKDTDTLWTQTLRYNPGSPRALHGRAHALYQAGDRASSEVHFRRALEAAPDYAEAHLGLAVLLLDEERYTEALTEARRHVELQSHPGAEAFLLITKAEWKLGHYLKAAEACEKAVLLDPRNSEYFEALTKVALARARVDESSAVLDMALRVSESTDLWVLKGQMVLLNGGTREESLKCYERAIKLDPQNPEPHLLAGRTLIEMKWRDLALQHLNAALELKPDLKEAQELVADLLAPVDPLAESETAPPDGPR